MHVLHMIVAKADESQELRNNFVLCFSTLIFYSKLQTLRAISTTKIVSLEIIVQILHSTKGLRLLSPQNLHSTMFCCDIAEVECFVGRADRSRDFGWYGRLVKSNTTCSITIFRLGRVQAKSWTCNLGSFRIQFKCVIRRFWLCRREKRIGTSPVSSTSTLVEHGGFVGK